MTTFLAWLYAAASKVYQFFGSAYATLYNGALNAWNWAVTQAANALNAAKSYAYQLFQSVSSVAGITVSWVLQQIQNAINGVRKDITGLFDWVEWKVNQVTGMVGTLVNNALTGVYDFINNVTSGFWSMVQSTSDYISAWVMNSFGWLLAIRDNLLSILSLLTVDTLRSLIAFLEQWRKVAVLFFADPAGFMLDLLQSKILDFLAYVIAWSLGTTKYELPGSAPWKK